MKIEARSDINLSINVPNSFGKLTLNLLFKVKNMGVVMQTKHVMHQHQGQDMRGGSLYACRQQDHQP